MKTGPLFIAAGVALLAGLFIVFKPKPGPEPISPAAEVAATAIPGAATAPGAATPPDAAAAPSAEVAAAPATPGPAAASAPARPRSPPKRFDLTIKDGKLIKGPQVLPVREGDEVQITITSNRADELHLHGYDFETQLKANETATLAFKAVRSGRFEFELHKAHVELGALEVQPKN